MSILTFGPATPSWNHTQPTDDNGQARSDYKLALIGTIVEIEEVQVLNYETRQPEFWADGNPKLQLKVTVADEQPVDPDTPELAVYFAPRSNLDTAFRQALAKINPRARGYADAGGLRVKFETQAPPQGFGYSRQNPRPWTVQFSGQGNAPFRGVKEFKKNDDQQQAQQPQQNVHPTPATAQFVPNNNGGFNTAPTQAQQAQAQQNFQQAQHQQQQPQYQQASEPEYVPASVYDEDIPF